MYRSSKTSVNNDGYRVIIIKIKLVVVAATVVVVVVAVVVIVYIGSRRRAYRLTFRGRLVGKRSPSNAPPPDTVVYTPPRRI